MERHEKPGSATEYSCKLQLPCNAPFERLEGPICKSMRLAQQVFSHAFTTIYNFWYKVYQRFLNHVMEFAGCLFGCLQETP